MFKNTFMADFNRTVRQMTEMFQGPKCLSYKWPKCFREKKKLLVNLKDNTSQFTKNTSL